MSFTGDIIDDRILYETYPFDEETKEILIENNFVRRGDFNGLKVSHLVRIGIPGAKARMVLRMINKEEANPTGEDGLSLLNKKSKSGKMHIVTFSQGLDNILGGGVELGSLTEICGAPGIGKTQFGLQLSINVQLPRDLGGVEGECIFIDTEGSMFIDRVKAIGNSFVKRINRMYQKKPVNKQININGVLERIHYYRIHTYFDQVAIINVLSQILDRNKQIKLVIIDSIAFHFRFGFDDFSLRARILQGIAQKLTKVAYNRKVAVVLMNQVTTKMEAGGQTRLIPALGQSWAHACKTRVILYKKEGNRCAFLYKSPTRKPDDTLFSITGEGIRDFTKKRERNHDEKL